MSTRSKIVLLAAALSLVVGTILTFSTLVGIYSCVDYEGTSKACTESALQFAQVKVHVGSVLNGVGFMGLVVGVVLAIIVDKKSKKQS